MLLTGHLAHTSLAYFLKNLVMAVGRADHEIPLTVKYSCAQGYAWRGFMATARNTCDNWAWSPGEKKPLT